MKSFFQKLFSFDSNHQKLFDSLESNNFFKAIIEKTKKINLPQISDFVVKILKILNSQNIKLDKFRELIRQGIPDELGCLRSLAWKVIVGYLPPKIDQWPYTLEKNRKIYKDFKIETYQNLRRNERFCEEELYKYCKSNNIATKERGKSMDLTNNTTELEVDISLAKHSSVTLTKVRTMDETYNLSKTKVSQNIELLHKIAELTTLKEDSRDAIKAYIADCDILDEINKDIRRTRSNMHFLFLPSKKTNNCNSDNLANIADIIRNDGYMEDEGNSNFIYETHLDVLARILFIYAKMNKKISYVQGMNELLIPFYYCFLNDTTMNFANDVEIDTFCCFDLFMGKIEEIYERKVNINENAIHIRLNKLKGYLKLLEEDIFKLFKKEKVELELFCFRWYALFLTQEFELPDVLRLWDSVLSEESYFDYMNCLCVALLKIKKGEIIKLKFCDIILNLKKLESIDIEYLIKVTCEVKKRYMKLK
jgi:hypothetical protein